MKWTLLVVAFSFISPLMAQEQWTRMGDLPFDTARVRCVVLQDSVYALVENRWSRSGNFVW